MSEISLSRDLMERGYSPDELNPGQDLGEVPFAEKRREDAVRDVDVQMVRWIADDLDRPQPLVAQMQRPFARGRR